MKFCIIPASPKDGSTPLYELAFLAMAIQSVEKQGIPPEAVIVEIGSRYGKSTITIASVTNRTVYAIDPHDNPLHKEEEETETLTRFKANVHAAGLTDRIKPLVMRSTDVEWDGTPIAVLFIDGDHEEESVRADFEHFYQYVSHGGYIIFHDYADFFPGVKKFVRGLIDEKVLHFVGVLHTMIVCQKPFPWMVSEEGYSHGKDTKKAKQL